MVSMILYEVIHRKKWVPRHLGLRISDLELRTERRDLDKAICKFCDSLRTVSWEFLLRMVPWEQMMIDLLKKSSGYKF